MANKYFIISPARNEEKLIEYTLHSIIKQSLLPEQWIIVDDGSSDNTALIVKKYCEEFSWITLISIPDRGYAKYGSGVVEAFYKGYELIKNEYFDYIVKLDCDLGFDPSYFEDIFSKFANDSRLGIASGHTYYKKNSELIWEDSPLDHTRGVSKIYRKACFEEIGGLKKTLGWDNIDEVTARMKGWITRSFPELKIIHHRQLGSTIGITKGNERHGYTDYITGYHPIYFIVKTLYRVFSKPYVIGSLFSFYGFFYASIKRKPRAVSNDFIEFIRKEQMQKLFNFSFWSVYVHKYNMIWRLGIIISFLFYYSGSCSLYYFLSKKILRNRRDFILTYHHINDVTDKSISVKVDSFEKQIRFLRKKYAIVSVEEMLTTINPNHGNAQRVAVTFDDGYSDFYNNAFPLLQKYGIPSCIFVIYNKIGLNKHYLSEDQIHRLIENNVIIGSHTLNHEVLSNIEEHAAEKEIVESKKKLEELFNLEINYFAYPKGKSREFNSTNVDAVAKAGYHAAFTTINGNLNSKRNLVINRNGVRHCPLFVFKARVSGIFESAPLLWVRKLTGLV